MDRKEFIKTSSAGVALSMMPFNILKGADDRVVRLGFIGVGSRGGGHLRGMLNRDDVVVNAICDIDPENAARGQEMVMATHDAAIVDAFRKRVVELEDGRVVRDQSRGVYGQAY